MLFQQGVLCDAVTMAMCFSEAVPCVDFFLPVCKSPCVLLWTDSVHVCARACVRVLVCARVRVCMHARVCVRVYVRVYVCVCVHLAEQQHCAACGYVTIRL